MRGGVAFSAHPPYTLALSNILKVKEIKLMFHNNQSFKNNYFKHQQ
jgi:hypothetical protein